MFNKTIEMYAEGYELIEIMEECNLKGEQEVLDLVRFFKEENKIPRKSRFVFTKEFKKVIADRFLSGELSMYQISTELELSASTVTKYLQQLGIDTKKVDNKNYAVIPNWDDFDCCPTCNREWSVRYLGIHNQEPSEENARHTHSFCSVCNTEWYEEVIGKDEDGNDIRETRKVLWYTIK